MIKHTPALGWNTWNTFTSNINEALVIESAKAMVETGLKDAGYEYIVVDDCWSLKERDENGRLVADPEKFPNGIKYVADKVHELGLKFGIYSCAGTVTCANYPGSYEHEFIDAKTFAEWGVDYLKYDYCFHSIGVSADTLYKRMGIALRNSGRDILFSACSWGRDDTEHWIKETGANSFRSTMDIADSWRSIKELAASQLKLFEYNGHGCYCDLDMLVVGMNNTGTIWHGEGCTYDEYFTHFAFWAFVNSPLMIGCDIRKMSEETKGILTNKGLLRINQDQKGCQPFLINDRLHKNHKLSIDNPYFYSDYITDFPVLAKMLDDGKIAIGFFNFTDGETASWQSTFNTDAVGVPESSGKTLLLTDVVTGEQIKVKNGNLILSIKAHASRVFIAEVVDK